MCGRYTLTKSPAEAFKNAKVDHVPHLSARYNIAPGQQICAVIRDPEANNRKMARLLEWGLIPSWTKERLPGRALINARAETIGEKASFRDAVRYRRCLIPADGYFEWRQNPDATKTPCYIRMIDARVFFFAGIWESWLGPGEEAVDSCAIITTGTCKLLKSIHQRMPVILEADKAVAWMNMNICKPGDLQHLMSAFPDDQMTFYPVSPSVNSPRNDNPDCIRQAE